MECKTKEVAFGFLVNVFQYKHFYKNIYKYIHKAPSWIFEETKIRITCQWDHGFVLHQKWIFNRRKKKSSQKTLPVYKLPWLNDIMKNL